MESGALKLKQIRLGGQAVIPVALVRILTKAVKRAAMQAPWENPNTALSQRVSGPPQHLARSACYRSHRKESPVISDTCAIRQELDPGLQ